MIFMPYDLQGFDTKTTEILQSESMLPKRSPQPRWQEDLVCSELSPIIDCHPLVKLAEAVDWDRRDLMPGPGSSGHQHPSDGFACITSSTCTTSALTMS